MNMTHDISTFQTERIMLTLTESKKIDYYIGLDRGLRTGGRGVRKSASPEFLLVIRSEEDDDITEDEYSGSIVAVAVPERDTTDIPTGTPVAIGEVEFQDGYWYMLFTADATRDETVLLVSDVLVQYDGEPEDLLMRPELFEPAED